MRGTLRWATDRSGPLVAVVLLVGVELLPRRMPIGVYLSGVVFGTWTALIAVGMVLTSQSDRLLNLAAFQCGAAASLLFLEGLQHDVVARAVTWHNGPYARGVLTAQWVVLLLATVVLAAVLQLACYVMVVRRLREAPPLVGTVATLAWALLLSGLVAVAAQSWFGNEVVTASTRPPIDVSLPVGQTVLHLPELLTLAVGVLVLPVLGVALRSRWGTAVRGAAANPERAATLGVSAAAVAAVVWSAGGALSGLAVVLSMSSSGPQVVGGLGPLLPALVAVVVARGSSVRVAAAVGVGTGVLQQGLGWSFHRAELGAAVLLGLLLVVLAGQRVDRGRLAQQTGWRAAREARPVPAALRSHPAVRRLRRVTAAGCCALVLGFPFLVPEGQVAAGTRAVLVALLGLSLLVLTGWAGLVSLGQLGVAALGAVTAAALAGWHAPFPVVVLAAALVAALGTVAVGLPALRVRGLVLAAVTLCLAAVVSTVLLGQSYLGSHLPRDLRRPSVLGWSTASERSYYLLCVALLGLVVAGLAGLRRSGAVRLLIAARDNERAAELLGAGLLGARVVALAVSGAVAGLAGALMALQEGRVDEASFGVGASLVAFLVVVLGGFGSLAGPVLGAVAFAVLAAFPQTSVGSLGTPLAVLAVLVALPGGLSQGVVSLRDLLLRRIAVRHRIAVPGLAQPVADGRIPIAPGPGEVEVSYALPRRPLAVAWVSSAGKGA